MTTSDRTPPHRRVTLKIDIGADDWESMADHLHDIAHRIEVKGPIVSLCSGGPSCGYSVTGIEDPDQTHEQYHEQLKAYLAAKREANHDQ